MIIKTFSVDVLRGTQGGRYASSIYNDNPELFLFQQQANLFNFCTFSGGFETVTTSLCIIVNNVKLVSYLSAFRHSFF